MTTVTLDLGRAYRLINHGPTVLVSTTDGAVPNACPVAWCAPASRSPSQLVLSLGTGHKTKANLRATRQCVVNVPTLEALDVVMRCGGSSGHDGDKLGPLGIETAPSRVVGAPRLPCCVAWIEARLASELGDGLVLLEAVHAEHRPGVLDGDGHFDVAAFPTLHHLGGSRFHLPGRVLEWDGE